MLLETSLTEFHGKLYIPPIQKLAFYFPRVNIIGTHHYRKELLDALKLQDKLHDVLFWCGYAEWVVYSFAHQIQSEYYGGNIYVSIEGISLEIFSASHHSSTLLVSDHGLLHAIFLPDDIKQDATTTSAKIKCIIEL